MRSFTNLSALPGHTVVIDGEAYNCPDVQVPDMRGTVRTVPADRVLAVQWHGDHGHGSVEGFGAMEGFTDKSQLSPYVGAWLRARAKAKAEKVDALVRQQAQLDEAIASNEAAMAGLEDNIVAETNQEVNAMNRRLLDGIKGEVEKMRSRRPTDAQVALARAELATAKAEADA